MKLKTKIIIFIAVYFLLVGLTRGFYDSEHYSFKDFILKPLPDWTDKYLGPNSGDMSYFNISSLINSLDLSRLQAVELQNYFRDLTSQGIISQKAFDEGLKRVRSNRFESGLNQQKLLSAPFIIVFDMDETLLQQYYNSWRRGPKYYDYKIKFNNGMRGVSMAPGWDKILITIKKLNGLAILYSANTDDVVWKIADTVIIKGKKLSQFVDGVLSNSYLVLQGKYEGVKRNQVGTPTIIPSKDLRILDPQLEKTIIVDDNPIPIMQNYNLRVPKKYEADLYFNNKFAKKIYDKQLTAIAAEIEQSYRYTIENKAKGILFTQAYLPYTQLGQVALRWLLESKKLTLSEAVEYIRRNPEIVDKKF